MRINGHAHIFTLQSVLSRYAIQIMANRLRKVGFREFIVDAVVEVLSAQLNHPEYLIEDELLVRFVRAMLRSPHFRVAGINLPVQLLVAGDGNELGVRALAAILDKLSSWIDEHDGPGKSPFDVLQTLRIAMRPTIPQVADSLLRHLGPDDLLIALMMDIVAENEPERDRLNFLSQIRGTQAAALALPGRVLPFIAVNPRRPNHFELMVDALEKRGFVGVKLYPSLGYEMTMPQMRSVLEYCQAHDVPITVHTTATGFSAGDVASGYANPVHWLDHLKALPDLRVCFAHCGGWGGLCQQDHDQAVWAAQIVQYMDGHPNVYADLSYHVDMMVKGGTAEAAYITTLKAFLAGPHADRIIFGTDSWLLRLNMDDALYWKYFERNLSAAELDLITQTNPAQFLGLPVAGAAARRNIQRYIQYIESHAGAVGATPAQWLRTATQVTWNVVASNPAWSRRNHAHVTAYNHFRSQIPPQLKGRGFDDCAGIRLTQLDYYALSGTPSDMVVTGNRRNLMALCKANGAVPEGGYVLQDIATQLDDIMREGRYTLSDLGGALDAMYRFESEVL